MRPWVPAAPWSVGAAPPPLPPPPAVAIGANVFVDDLPPVAGEAALAKLRREADERARELRRLKGAARA
jgi:hypothetical protein